MINSNNIYFRSQKDIFSESNTPSSEKRTTLLNKATLPYFYVFPIIHIKRRQQSNRFVHFTPKNYTQYPTNLIGCMITGIQFGRHFHSIPNGIYQFIVSRIRRGNHLSVQISFKNSMSIHNNLFYIRYKVKKKAPWRLCHRAQNSLS